MALVDPYAPCHCGSGQKYKWCCQRVEAYAERSQRLLDNGQYELAIKPLVEGLAKVPDNVSLLLAQGAGPASSESDRAGRRDPAPLAPETPGHLGGSILMTRLVAGHRGRPGRRRPVSAGSFGPTAAEIARSSRRWPRSSVRRWAARATRPRRSSISSSPPGFRATKRSRVAVASPESASQSRPSRSGRRTPIASGRRPSTLPPAFRESFEQALGWAEEGLWSSAASAFELLAAGSGAGVIADRNRGLCCLWLADHEGAVAALRRYIARTKPTTDAVDLEALCQKIEPPSRHDLVEFDRLSWPIRNRDGLLAALARRSSDRREDPTSILSIPTIRRSAEAREFPAARSSRDRGQAGPHAGRTSRWSKARCLSIRTSCTWKPRRRPARPPDRSVHGRGGHRIFRRPIRGPRSSSTSPGMSWPCSGDGTSRPGSPKKRPSGSSASRLPISSPRSGPRRPTRHFAGGHRFRRPGRRFRDVLARAIRRMEAAYDQPEAAARLERAPREAPPEPGAADRSRDGGDRSASPVATGSGPHRRLDDDRLLALYRQAVKWGLRRVTNRVARLIDQRPSLMMTGRIEVIKLYGDLALEAAHDGDRAEADDWLARGRQAESPQKAIGPCARLGDDRPCRSR